MKRQHDAEKYELSDAEKRDLIKIINEDKPIPEKYRFILFEDEREVELVWNGKTREVSTHPVPPAWVLEFLAEFRITQARMSSLETLFKAFNTELTCVRPQHKIRPESNWSPELSVPHLLFRS
jgi:site-specific DNA-methyltransferase (adenine-specific)/adenine-specific DNA-methyltransferase